MWVFPELIDFMQFDRQTVSRPLFSGDPFYFCPQPLRSLSYELITSIYLVNILYHTPAFRAQCSDQQSHTGPDVRAAHGNTSQSLFTGKPDDRSPMRIAQNNLSTHINQFIYEEQAAFKHFLMHQDATPCLSGNDQNNTQ